MSISEAKTTEMASANSLDDIASLLSSEEQDFGEEQGQEDEATEAEQEFEEPEGQPDDSNESEVDESDEDQEVTWSNALGVNPEAIVTDEDGNLAGINVKVDGTVSTVDLKTLIDGYQFNKSNTQKAQAIAEERKQIEAFKATAVQEYSTKLENAEKLVAYMNNRMLKEFENIDWQTLRVTNPGEYAAALEDFKIRQEEINKIFTAVDTEKQSLQEQNVKQLEQAKQAHFEEQAKIILSKNPEWADAEKFKSTMSEFSSFMADSYGFSLDEFASIADARVIEVIKDAYKYKKGIDVASKKIEPKLPKFQKTSSKPAKKVTKLDTLIKSAKSAKGYNRKQLQDNAITELLTGVL